MNIIDFYLSLSLSLSSLIAGCCYKFLENPVIGRDKDLRGPMANLLGLIVKKYNQSLSELLYLTNTGYTGIGYLLVQLSMLFRCECKAGTIITTF